MTTRLSMPPLSATERTRLEEYHRRRDEESDRIFAVILIVQWALSIAIAIIVSPKTWEGSVESIHIHVYGALLLGAVLTLIPLGLILAKPGRESNKLVIAVAQMGYSILLIHLTGGRIETHFHVFGSLAFLAFYRDLRPVILASTITALDHFLRGAWWPESVYGTLTSTPWRALEHAAWVVFEDIFLVIAILENRRSDALMIQAQLELERSYSSVEQKVAEAERRILDQQASLVQNAKLATLGEMAGNIAHEINNPLAIIAGRVGILLQNAMKNSMEPKKVKESLEVIRSTVERAASIIRGLKNFSRNADSDPMEEVKVATLIQDALSLCSERMKKLEIQVEIGVLPEISIPCRQAQISQVLLNLIGNASDAIGNLPSKWIRIESGSYQSGGVWISVTDSGLGIPSEIANQMMLPFFTTKEVGKGTGLGLSISKGIIESHGGQLRLDRSSQNTRFVMEFFGKQVTKNRLAAA